MTKARATHPDGRRKLTEEQKARIRDTTRRRYAELTPEQKEAQLARIGRRPRGSGSPAPPPPSGGPTSPLDDALGAGRRRDPVAAAAQGVNGAPPTFLIPDVEPIGFGEDGGEIPESTLVPAPAGGLVTEQQIEAFVRLPLEVLAVRRGEHWKLRPEEAALLVPPLTRKLNEHAAIARGLAVGGDYVIIAGALFAIASARILEDLNRARENDAAGRNAGGAGLAAAGRPGPSPLPPDGPGEDRGVAPGGVHGGSGQGGLINGVPVGPGFTQPPGAGNGRGPATLDPDAPLDLVDEAWGG